jgi:hypothetical protein
VRYTGIRIYLGQSKRKSNRLDYRIKPIKYLEPPRALILPVKSPEHLKYLKSARWTQSADAAKLYKVASDCKVLGYQEPNVSNHFGSGDSCGIAPLCLDFQWACVML